MFTRKILMSSIFASTVARAAAGAGGHHARAIVGSLAA
jgi:hypothetical protein